MPTLRSGTGSSHGWCAVPDRGIAICGWVLSVPTGMGGSPFRRGAYPHVVRTSRYAAAVALQGRVLASDDLVLHLCDLPLCAQRDGRRR